MSNDMEHVTTEPRRDRWQRYLIVPEGGGKAVPMTRATTVSGILDDRHAIEKWQQRHVALGLAQRSDLLAAVQTAEADDKSAINEVCKLAMEASGADSAARMGTALHAVVEAVNLDPDAEVPEAFAERIAEYRRVMAEFGVEVVRDCVERVHVLSTMGIAGMADAHVVIGGRRYIFDLKTGSSVDYGAGGYAVQLAIYANATTLYDFRTDTHEPMPLDVDKQRAVICHLPAKGGPATLKWLDIGSGAEALRHAHFAYQWRKRRDLMETFAVPAATNAGRPTADLVGEAFPSTTVDEVATAELLDRRRQRLLAALPPVDEAFKARWRSELVGVPGPKKADEWGTEEMDAVERVFELPWTDEPAPPATVPDAATVADVVPIRKADDLGGPVDAGALQMLRERARRQSNGVKAWIRVWQAEAVEDGSADFKMGRGKFVTLWAYEVSRAAMYLARVVERAEATDAGLSAARALVRSVVGDVADQEGVTLGGVLGSLSLDEATRLADLATDADEKGTGVEGVAS